MNYKIALCDDDTNYMDELEKLLKKCSQQEDLLEIVKCTSGEQLLNSDIDNADVVLKYRLNLGNEGIREFWYTVPEFTCRHPRRLRFRPIVTY